MTVVLWRVMAVVAVIVTACDSGSDREAPPPADASATSRNRGPTAAASIPAPSPSAALAVTVAPYVVAGWWEGHGWVPADGKRPVPVSGGETYEILGLTGLVTTGTGSEAREGCETDPGTSMIKISGMEFNGSGPGPIAVSSVATPRPRLTSILDPAAPVYREAAGNVMTERGIDDPDADVVQALRTDLEGDGKDEVLVVAERIADRTGLYARPGDYSFVLLRRVVNGTVRTTIVAESVPDVSPDTTPFIYSHRVSAIADLNADGRMEVALELRQYEGIGVSVYELQPDGAMTAVMGSDCGA
jgi:hypothetical protein